LVAVSVIAGTIAAGLLGAVMAAPLVSIAWAVIGELRSPDPEVAQGVFGGPGETSGEGQ
jgi:predicted PurR-regulated permease PerM